MRLIVGLGNPDPEYEGTPHNLGFDVVERLASQARIRTRSQQGRARVWRGRLDQEEVVLAQPLTYMNLSGEAVAELLRGHGLTPADLVVILDDVALPFGQLRIRERGSAGGHRGLESVLAAVGTDEVARVRLGIQPLDVPQGGMGDLADYVLNPMDDEQRRAAEKMVAEAAEAVRLMLREGAARAMERFNRRQPAGPEAEG